MLHSYTYVSHLIDKRHGFPIDTLEDRIWFKDSILIYEVRSINEIDDQTNSGEIVKNSYDVLKYTYMDLRNRTCQDYYNFSDTALPFCNYYLPQGESIVWKFDNKKNEGQFSDSLKLMPDTIIGNRKLKRLQSVHYYYGNSSYEYEYFLDCNSPKNIFQINRDLEKKFPNCKVVRSDLVDLNSPERKSFEFKITREILLPDETAIFKKWGTNAHDIKLPLLTYKESQKSCAPFLNLRELNPGK